MYICIDGIDIYINMNVYMYMNIYIFMRRTSCPRQSKGTTPCARLDIYVCIKIIYMYIYI